MSSKRCEDCGGLGKIYRYTDAPISTDPMPEMIRIYPKFMGRCKACEGTGLVKKRSAERPGEFIHWRKIPAILGRLSAGEHWSEVGADYGISPSIAASMAEMVHELFGRDCCEGCGRHEDECPREDLGALKMGPWSSERICGDCLRAIITDKDVERLGADILSAHRDKDDGSLIKSRFRLTSAVLDVLKKRWDAEHPS